MKTIAVDFDGVLHDYKHPVKGMKMGPPIDGAKEAMTELKHAGWEVIVFSVWGDAANSIAIRKWLGYYRIPFSRVTNVKPNADIYLDDRAIRFTSWGEFLEETKL